MKRKPTREPIPCPHSPSCFTCPMKDCVATAIDGNIALLNALPGDFDLSRHERVKEARVTA